MKWRERFAWGLLILVAAGGTIVACRSPSAAGKSSGTMVCSANPCVVQASNNGVDGLRVVGSRGPALDHPFIVEDWAGDPQFFVNIGSVDTGDLWFCTTSADLTNRACLTSGTWNGAKGQFLGAGELALWASGTSKPVFLTVRDIAWIHAHGG